MFMDWQVVLQLILAAILGGLMGLEREYKRKEAGLRTYSLVSLGAAFFTIISYQTFDLFSGKPAIDFDPTRIIGQIVLGIGFLGAGLIIFRGFHIEGLTTAAGLWVAAAVGVAIGARFYFPAIFVTFLTIGILAGLRLLEEKIFGKTYQEPSR
jgi:putative Mg2+ transporter-C (MgtC) family protein